MLETTATGVAVVVEAMVAMGMVMQDVVAVTMQTRARCRRLGSVKNRKRIFSITVRSPLLIRCG